MKLTSKGQLTIPQAMRLKYGLEHAEVGCFPHAEGVLVKKVGSKPGGGRALSALKSGAKLKGTTSKWLNLTRGE